MLKQTTQLIQEPTILMVEDDIQLVEIFSKALQHNGYQTICVHNGNDVHHFLKKHKIDLILLDIMLPGKDGFQILKELKNAPDTRNLPIIILTTLGEVEHIEKGIRLGASDYIIKHNVDFQKIHRIIHKYLISKDARQNMQIE